MRVGMEGNRREQHSIMTPERKAFYSSKQWQDCRNAYYKYRKGLCEQCLKEGRYTAGVIVHHKKHLTADNFSDPSIALSFDNLQLLCRDCHAKEHTGKLYKVDEMGRVVFI